MNLEKLKAPFSDNDLDWRVGQGGFKNGQPWVMLVCYVDARAVMDRLDEVVGPDNWKDGYTWVGGGVVCTLHIKIGDEWVWKNDGGIESNTEAFKGSISDSFKRAAVKWGVGRYLYNIPRMFGQLTQQRGDDTITAHIKDKNSGEQAWVHIVKPKLNMVGEGEGQSVSPNGSGSGNPRENPPTTQSQPSNPPYRAPAHTFAKDDYENWRFPPKKDGTPGKFTGKTIPEAIGEVGIEEFTGYTNNYYKPAKPRLQKYLQDIGEDQPQSEGPPPPEYYPGYN